MENVLLKNVWQDIQIVANIKEKDASGEENETINMMKTSQRDRIWERKDNYPEEDGRKNKKNMLLNKNVIVATLKQ